MSYKDAGGILRRLRGEKTQAQVADELGITKSAWAMYERGVRVPRDETKVLIAEHFGRSVQEIFFAPAEH